jgi:uncharacterized membrane-anchored protein
MSRSVKSIVAVAAVVANCLLVLAVVNGAIAKKQAIVESGRTVFLELAPVDPRSLMQGDYMVLAYALNRDKQTVNARGIVPTRGRMILSLDEQEVATFSRFEETKDGEEAESLEENEIALKYRKWRRGFRFGIESFFFEEGKADTYAQAKFAEIRVSEDGRPVLVDLRGPNLKTLPLQDDLPSVNSE